MSQQQPRFFVVLVSFLLVTCVRLQQLPKNSELDEFIFDGPCPKKIAAISNFDVESYLGIWYEIERYEQPFQISTDCVTALYGLFNNGSISVTNQGLLMDNGTKTAAEGLAELSFPSFDPLPGELKVSFNNRPQTTTNYYVIDTDYERFSVIYNCVGLPENKSAQSFWILSRNNSMTTDLIVCSRIDEIKLKYKIQVNKIRRTDQSDESCQQNVADDKVEAIINDQDEYVDEDDTKEYEEDGSNEYEDDADSEEY